MKFMLDGQWIAEKAIMDEKELFKLLASRRGKLGALKRKRNEINAAIEAGENKETVAKHVETFNTVLADWNCKCLCRVCWMMMKRRLST